MKRVIFKLASATGSDPRSKEASDRECLIGYDLDKAKFLFFRAQWGHPAWSPDSRTLINVPNVLIDSDNGQERPIPQLPKFPGSHPSIASDGKLFATDITLQNFGGTKAQWGLVVGDLAGKRYQILHRFNNSQGAKSWRVSHPHPIFSPDGRRIYFKVSDGKWTQLYVAELE
jgi:Tol biopolymer transport system component